MADRCGCGLPLDAPSCAYGLRPSVEEPPGPEVLAMVRYGQDTRFRRVERVEASSDCWVVRGACGARTARLGVLLRWAEVGYCGHDHEHAMVAVYDDSDEEA